MVESDRPLIVQSDKTLFLEVESPYFAEVRDHLGAFAELIKCPEHIHTYRISPLSLWNASSAGMTSDEVIEILRRYSRYAVPRNVEIDIAESMKRYGRLVLEKDDTGLLLRSDDPLLLDSLSRQKTVGPYMMERLDPYTFRVGGEYRGNLKQNLIKLGYPVKDLAGYVPGAPLSIRLRETTLAGKPFHLRDYQKDAIAAFYRGGSREGGSGVVVLPCGAGKTVVGLGVIAAMQTHTLILVTNVVALRQWKRELVDKTLIDPDLVCEYSGEAKDIGPITVATYQILTYRKKKSEGFPHLGLFAVRDWGLIIYDEVHLLPAPVFRITAEIQARRRLGLTATLVREDRMEEDVFSLIGPKCFDVPWKVLEEQGWIATAECHEVRIPFPIEERRRYVLEPPRVQFRIASENPLKMPVVQEILRRYQGSRTLVIGQYLSQLQIVADELNCPLITGSTPNKVREDLYEKFRQGEILTLVVSKVANFAIDLPEAHVAIQISGTFGSRQEEAQRLGRILRPKSDGAIAHFYTLVTRDSNETEFAQKRQLFLTEQGYKYHLESAEIYVPELAA